MKILVSWLRDFVDVPDAAAEIADTLSVRGFAVEGIEPLSAGDAVIDVEVTANRPDCLSVLGIAREVATAYRVPVRDPAARVPAPLGGAAPQGSAPWRPDLADATAAGSDLRLTPLRPVPEAEVGIAIDAPDLCSRYAGAVADVRVAPSPAWMQERLRAAGVRPISNIVDVTNYVLVELGQPMHAFDLVTLEGAQIRVRTARPGEALRTLDGQVRELSTGMLVIADAARPVAIAGVMGGADSEVTDGTTTIVLESAHFDSRSVRRTSKLLGLKTEASTRFERGTDPQLPVVAMARASALLEMAGAGQARGTVVDRHPSVAEPLVLRLRHARVSGLLGAAVAGAEIERILESLGFVVREAPDGWAVSVPTRRVDVSREVDLIEEVARHHGFEQIPVTFPALASAPPPVDPRITRGRRLRAAMTSAGFSEAVTFGFTARATAAPFTTDEDLVPIANPLSETFAVLRPAVLPGLIEVVAHNRRREQRDVRVFEIGARFSRTAGERHSLACAWIGAVGGDHWGGGQRPVDFFDLEGVVERVCDVLRVDARTVPHQEPWLVPGRAAALMAGARRIGVLGQLAPDIAGQHRLAVSDGLYVAEIDLDAADAAAIAGPFAVEPLPRHPSVSRDVSILVDAGVPAAEVRATIAAVAPSTLVRVREFDRYQGVGVPEGRVSLSLRLVFRAPDRTLTDMEVQSAMDVVISALGVRHRAVQR